MFCDFRKVAQKELMIFNETGNGIWMNSKWYESSTSHCLSQFQLKGSQRECYQKSNILQCHKTQHIDSKVICNFKPPQRSSCIFKIVLSLRPMVTYTYTFQNKKIVRYSIPIINLIYYIVLFKEIQSDNKTVRFKCY